jgi:serine/threonine protein kinase
LATRRHHSDKGLEAPTEPTDWDDLAKRVLVQGALYLHDPAVFSRIKIGRFEAQVKIGRGGFGIVFKAHDPKLNRWVALKLCLTRNPDAFDAFMDEARVLAELDHPNIVAVLEPGEYEGSPFFVMPYIDGENARISPNERPHQPGGRYWRCTSA